MGRSRHPTSGKRRWQTFNSCCLIFLFHQTGGIKVMVGLRWFSAVKNEHHRRLLLSLFFILVSGLLSNNCLGNELSAAAAAPAEHHRRLRRSALGSSNLGKRITSSLVAELGKRPKEMYSFGIGKRSISEDEMEDFLEESRDKAAAAHSENGHQNNQENLFSSEKRDPYAFGLGKRGGEYSFGLGRKRDPYAFGLGKRQDYAFGMGKKDDPYAFGLGKRADRYAFGLGKRDPYAFGLGKRDPYAFGLGKR